MYARTHGAKLDAQRGGDLLVGQALDIAQHHGGTKVRRQGVQGTLNVVVKVGVGVVLLRADLLGGQPSCGLVRECVETDALFAAHLV